MHSTRVLLTVILIFVVSCKVAPRYSADTQEDKAEFATRSATDNDEVATLEELEKAEKNGGQSETIKGKASYYGKKFHGKKTASGEVFDMNKLSAAHRTYPFGTILKVTNLATSKSVEVKVNDRGPFVKGRILDLSYEAAKQLEMIKSGTTEVQIEVVKLGQE